MANLSRVAIGRAEFNTSKYAAGTTAALPRGALCRFIGKKSACA
jgi:hypothetical protein